MPAHRKPLENLRQRDRRGEWTALPVRCKSRAPKWPTAEPTDEELAMWCELWALPVAAWWHEQRISPRVIARYVRLSIAKPELATLSRIEADLAMTPAAMDRLRLVVHVPEPEPEAKPSPYAHLVEGS